MKRRTVIKGALAAVAAVVLPKNLLAFEGSAAEVAADFKVINAGIGGNNTVDLLKRIDKDCLARRPRLTILMVGTNDMNSAKHIPLADYENNLNQIVKQIKASGSKVLMMTILPCYEPDLLTRHKAEFYQPEGVEGRRKQINAVVRKLAAKHKAYLLDLGHRFSAIGNLGIDKDSLIQNMANSNKRDGIHPTPTGYRFIGLTVYDFIVDHKLPTSGILCFGDSITKGDGSIDKNSYPAYLSKLLTTADEN